MNKKITGEMGETIAINFLKKKGYKIRQRNFRCREGEIDIIAEYKKNLVFVEVRSKSSSDFGTPEESITFAKKEKVINTALTYLSSQQKAADSWQIDFIGIEFTQDGKVRRINHLENAIQR